MSKKEIQTMKCTLLFILLIKLNEMGVFSQMLTSGRPQNESEACECGVPNPSPRIVGGQPVFKNKYPWMVNLAIQFMRMEFMGQIIVSPLFCGGTLISQDWVLTAAHCAEAKINMARNIVVNLGFHDVSMQSEGTRDQITVTRIITHPNYNPETLDYDISLLKLIRSVKFTQAIRPACIPPPNLNVSGKTATAIGWGDTIAGGRPASELREVTMPLFTQDECETFFNNSGLTLTPRMICAGDPQGGKDSCRGDSGGPLLYECKENLVVAGIVSFGIGCALPGQPGIYAKVSEVTKWIQQITGSAACIKECT